MDRIKPDHEELERQALALFKTAPLVQVFSMLELLAEKIDVDGGDLKLKAVLLCDELRQNEQDRLWSEVIKNDVHPKPPNPTPFYRP